MTHISRFVAMLACCVAASALLAGPAWAAQSFRMTYHEEGTRVHQDFCGSAGLTVSDEFVIDGKLRAVPHGPDRLEYFLDTRKETSIVTNLANRQVVTFVLTVTAKDLKVTDNGDGTLTIIALFTGNVVLYGHDGKAIGRDPVRADSSFSSTTAAHRPIPPTTSSSPSDASRARPAGPTTFAWPPCVR